MEIKLFISSLVAFFVLINPLQKVLVMNTLQKQFTMKQLHYIAFKSSFAAMLILLFFLLLGDLVFNYVFHIQLYAFRITCGLVLIINGLAGLQQGVFFKVDDKIKIDDLTAVPIAMPMIAGPATITAAVTFSAHYGRVNTILSIIIALALNMGIILFAPKIGKFLTRYNFLNALIRITGLIVATIGLQMIFDGATDFIVGLPK